jgi:hypothetical protein
MWFVPEVCVEELEASLPIPVLTILFDLVIWIDDGFLEGVVAYLLSNHNVSEVGDRIKVTLSVNEFDFFTVKL